MSRHRNGFGVRLLAVAAGLVLSGAVGHAQEVHVGTVRTLPVISVCLAVGSVGKDAKRVVYTPPPGWYIRSHRVDCAKKFGLSSYTVSTVPAGWQWSSDEQVHETARVSGTATASAAHALPVGGAQGGAEADRTQAGRQHSTSSHHALVVEAVAAGAGFLRGGAGVELTVSAEMVYLGARQ